jgi:hypothetical protein
MLPRGGVFSVVAVTLLATSVTRRPPTQRLVAVAGLVLTVALLVAGGLVDEGCPACHHHTVAITSHGTLSAWQATKRQR